MADRVHRGRSRCAQGLATASSAATASSNRSRLIWSPARVRWSARKLRRWNGVRPSRRIASRCSQRGIALVALPAVARVARGEQASSSGRAPPWRRSTRRRSCSSCASPSTIAVYGPTWRLEAGDPIAVHEHVIVAAQPRDRAAHREVGGVVDVESRRSRGPTPRPRPTADGCAADDRREPLALARRERLGVADPGDPMASGPHDHGRGHDTAPHVGATPTSSTPTTRSSARRARGRARSEGCGTRGAIVAVRVAPASAAAYCAGCGAPGGWRPCRRACAGSTAGRAGRGRGGRPRSSRCAGS